MRSRNFCHPGDNYHITTKVSKTSCIVAVVVDSDLPKKYFGFLVTSQWSIMLEMVMLLGHVVLIIIICIMTPFYDCYFILAMFLINLHSISSWWVADWLNISVYLELSLVKLWLSQAKTMPCSKSPLVKDSSSYIVWNMQVLLLYWRLGISHFW